eukprot:TRINITY_DN3723_c1_g4_i1.p1 TRINITY_DN3723_c1_g4~~TRINITY_DN3723_c1_g4_i1.p1  ORF type:complete len:335 (-),score=-31.83 TRINITY_DN3723_c1_g4_i1:99-1034(-)
MRIATFQLNCHNFVQIIFSHANTYMIFTKVKQIMQVYKSFLRDYLLQFSDFTILLHIFFTQQLWCDLCNVIITFLTTKQSQDRILQHLQNFSKCEYSLTSEIHCDKQLVSFNQKLIITINKLFCFLCGYMNKWTKNILRNTNCFQTTIPKYGYKKQNINQITENEQTQIHKSRILNIYLSVCQVTYQTQNLKNNKLIIINKKIQVQIIKQLCGYYKIKIIAQISSTHNKCMCAPSLTFFKSQNICMHVAKTRDTHIQQIQGIHFYILHQNIIYKMYHTIQHTKSLQKIQTSVIQVQTICIHNLKMCMYVFV